MFIFKFNFPDFQCGCRFLDPTVKPKHFCKREMNNLFTEYSETEGHESAETKENVSFTLTNNHLHCMKCLFRYLVFYFHFTLIKDVIKCF